MNDMLPNTPQKVRAVNCARIPNVTRVQLCSRLQQAAKRRVDQHPAVTAVPEKPRTQIVLVMRQRIELQSGLTFPQAHSKRQPHAKYAAVLQLFACGPVLYPLDWVTRSQLGTRFFAIHVRVSSNCTHTYRSRWGRATCLSNWAQGLNMERLRARAPWRSHTQTP